MSTVVKDLGAVSAYAYAVEKGYTGTEAEFAELMADYAEVGQRAEDAAESASASATASAQSASQASASEQGCARAVLDATSAAAIARTRADEASGYAQTASMKASEAVGCVETATQKATESAQSASQALGYKNDAESAKTASQTAQGLAESARDSAISAKNDAESARDEAQEIVDGINAKAEQIDTNTADITELESTKADLSELYKAFPTDTASGAIASFPDGADGIPLKSLVVDINPVQDLHGQDAPWPAGGGKNKLPLTVDRIKALNPNVRGTWTGNSYTYLGITYTLVTDSDGNIIKIHVSGTKTGASYFDLAKINSIPYGTYILNGGASGINVRAYHFDGTHIASSNSAVGTQFTSTDDAGNNTFDIVIATDIEVNADVYPMVRLTSETDATFAPYENICPISGWTEVQANQSGINVWDEEWEVGGIDYNTGATVPYLDRIRSKNYVPVKAGESLYVSSPLNASTDYVNVAYYDANKIFVSGTSTRSRTWQIPDNACFLRFTFPPAYGTTYNNDIAINYTSTDTAYEPYSGNQYTIQLGQTVYGGKLDVLSGELVIDMAMVDLGTLVWTVASGASSPSGKLFQAVSNIAKPRERYTPNNVICTIYKTADQNVWFTGDYLDLTVGVGNTGRIIVRDDRYDNDITAFKSAVSGVQLVYELAEPIEIQLSANQINSLLGVNNIWADSGDTEVEYRADTKLFIERLTAPDSADMVADANITSGQYFMVGNNLFKATANIANGSAIVVGTNCIRKSLSEALNEINA